MCSVGTTCRSGGADLALQGGGEGAVPGQGAALPQARCGVVASRGRDGQNVPVSVGPTPASGAFSLAGPPLPPRVPPPSVTLGHLSQLGNRY